jgi:hypothetical protein
MQSSDNKPTENNSLEEIIEKNKAPGFEHAPLSLDEEKRICPISSEDDLWFTIIGDKIIVGEYRYLKHRLTMEKISGATKQN